MKKRLTKGMKMKQPPNKSDTKYRLLNNTLNEARSKYLKAEIRMQIHKLDHGATSANFDDTDRILQIITDTIKKDNNEENN